MKQRKNMEPFLYLFYIFFIKKNGSKEEMKNEAPLFYPLNFFQQEES